MFAAAAWAICPDLVPAQEQAARAAREVASLSGLVLDQADMKPVEGVLVALHDFSVRARTDEEGRFLLPGIPAGQIVLKVERNGYITLVEMVEIAPLEESLIHFHLHRVTALLDELFVAVPRDSDERARGHSESEIVATDEDTRTAADMLLRSVPGLTASRSQGGAGSGLRVRLRGVSSFVLSDRPSIYLDGVRIDAGGERHAIEVLDQIRASSVKRIRVLRGPASTSKYPNAAAGVILVETWAHSGGPGG
jgi:iron complex outermembrane receptor protein